MRDKTMYEIREDARFNYDVIEHREGKRWLATFRFFSHAQSFCDQQKEAADAR